MDSFNGRLHLRPIQDDVIASAAKQSRCAYRISLPEGRDCFAALAMTRVSVQKYDEMLM